MKNILIPTDFSDNANIAADYALQLYANERCTIYFLHSIYLLNPESRTHITTHYIDELHQQGLKKLEELKIEKKRFNANYNFESILSEKKLSIAIDKAVKAKNIELIVMGTKGTTASLDFFAGSNTIDIVKRIKSCPVLVIPDNYSFVQPKQIAFPTEFSRFYDDKEIEPLKNIAKLYNSKIRVAHINRSHKLSDIQEHNRELLHEYLSDYEHNFHFIIDFAKKSASIENFINEFNIELLVMVNYKHSFIENIIKEPVIKSLVFHPKIPMLIIPK